MTREDITQQIIAARLAKGLTWQQLADAIGKPVVWTTAALLGQHPIPSEQGRKLVDLLGLDASAVAVLAAVPMRGSLPTAVPTDPTIYRFYEVLQVYGGAIKELIHEEFGEILTVFSFFTVFSVFRRTVHRPVNATCNQVDVSTSVQPGQGPIAIEVL
jgi:cyanate lyase